jgi:hypothetical protein
VLLANLVEAAELDSRAAHGLVMRQSLLDVRCDLLIEMEAHLLVQIVVDPPACKERTKPMKKIDHHGCSQAT